MRKPVARLGKATVTALVLVLVGLPVLAEGTAARPHLSAIRPKDGTYKGVLLHGLKKVVYMTVTRHGTKADARLICDGQPYGHARMSISKGVFVGRHQLSPGVQVWTLQGHFGSSTTAVAHLGGAGVCDGKSGKITLARI